MMWGRINVHWPVAPTESAPGAGAEPGSPGKEAMPVDREAIIEWLREEAGLLRDESDLSGEYFGPPFDIRDN